MADDFFTDEEYAEKLDRRAVIIIESAGLSEDFYNGLFAIFAKHRGTSEIIMKFKDVSETIVALVKNIRINVDDKLINELEIYSGGLVTCIY